MADNDKTTTDQILDLLLDALVNRQAQRQESQSALPTDAPISSEPAMGDAVDALAEAITDPQALAQPSSEEDALALSEWDETTLAEDEEAFDEEAFQSIIPEKLPSIHLEKMLFQLAMAVFIIIIVINIPFNRFGTNLARAMPDEQAVVVRDGLVVKGSGDEIYVIENNQKRWISSLDAFDYFGYRWAQVNEVDDDFLAQFENGRPLHVLLKCNSSPHVYALEDGEKRWINNITTFQNEGYVWEDVKLTSCAELRRIPDGLPIPVDAGDPP